MSDRVTDTIEDWPGAEWIELIERDPWDKVVWFRLIQIGREIGKGKPDAAVVLDNLLISIQSKKRKLVPRRELLSRHQPEYTESERLLLEEHLSRPHEESSREWLD